MAGMKDTLAHAEKGMALFQKEAVEFEIDLAGATAFKLAHDAAVKAKEDEAATMTGKENKKARSDLCKEIAAMKAEEKYVDACKVVKGLPPPKGHFQTVISGPETKAEEESEPAKAASAPVNEEPKKSVEKKSKTAESAGISKDERLELEKLKADIIKRKTELKEQGLSGGQCNKDEQVVAWVARMQELKIKEDPSLADAGKKDDKKPAKKTHSSEEKLQLEKKIEDYRHQLKSEFGYSDKDIKADPDMQDMQKQLTKLK